MAAGSRGATIGSVLVTLPERSIPAARQSFIREHNLSLVLRHIVEAPEPVSRARIAKTTGLTRATVSALVDSLLSGGMVRELVPAATERAGRPAVPLVPSDRGVVGLGLGVQVDHIGARLVGLAGNVIEERIVPGNFRASDPDAVLGRLAELADRLLLSVRQRGQRLVGVGVSLPGTVQASSRLFRYAPNLDWYDLDVAARLEAHPGLAGLPVLVGNDADLGARAEARSRARAAGLPPESQSFLYVTCEVGLGGAMIVRGELPAGWTGDLGHIAVDRAGPPCSCGARGCLEQYAGRDSMLIRSGMGVGSSMDDLRHAVDAGERAPEQSVAEAAEGLGVVISSTLNLVDMDTVVLGGAFVPLADLLIPTIQRHIKRRTFQSRWQSLTVAAGVAGQFAPLTGAALLVTDEVLANPSALLAVG